MNRGGGDSDSSEEGNLLDLPDSLVLEISKYLSSEDVVKLSQVSTRLHSVLQDNLLWKYLFVRDWIWKQKTARLNHGNPKSFGQLKKAVVAKNDRTWKSEYVRLKDRVPKHKVQVLSGHTDEVLHLTFSHDGKDLASCSKDHSMKIWREAENGQFSLAQSVDMLCYDWLNTWAVYYNQNDDKLLIGGVLDSIRGEVAIFQRGDTYKLLCRSVNDPFDVMGAWFSNDYFVTGWLSSTDANLAMVWLCCSNPDTRSTSEQEFLREQEEDNDQPRSSLYKRLLFSFNRTCFLRYLKVFSRPKGMPVPETDGAKASQDVIELDNVLLVSTTEAEDTELSSLVQDCDMFVAFLCSSDLTYVPHQVAFQNVTSSILDKTKTMDISDGEVVIEMHGHIVGMHVSPCQKYMFVNVRSWPDNCTIDFGNPPVIAREVEVKVIDLHTFQVVRNVVYAGHTGLTESSSAFYLYLNASDEYLCSGSEEGARGGCLWDRHYSSLVSQLPHEKCVNCVALHPTNNQLCVSASDDHTIGVWMSSQMMRDKRQNPVKKRKNSDLYE